MSIGNGTAGFLAGSIIGVEILNATFVHVFNRRNHGVVVGRGLTLYIIGFQRQSADIGQLAVRAQVGIAVIVRSTDGSRQIGEGVVHVGYITLYLSQITHRGSIVPLCTVAAFSTNLINGFTL